MTVKELVNLLIQLPQDKEVRIGCMDDFGAWGTYHPHYVEDKGKYIEIGE